LSRICNKKKSTHKISQTLDGMIKFFKKLKFNVQNEKIKIKNSIVYKNKMHLVRVWR